MKLKIIKHSKVPLVDGATGKPIPSAFGRSLDYAAADLFREIRHDNNGFVVPHPDPGNSQNDRLGQKIFSPGFPVTIMGWILTNDKHQCYSIEIGDRDTAYKLWRLGRNGYLASFLTNWMSKDGPKDRQRNLKQIWSSCHLHQDSYDRDIGRLAGYSRYYSGGGMLPDMVPIRSGERWLGTEMECFMPKAYSREDLLKAFQNKYIWGICAKGDGSLIPPNGDYLPVELVLCRPRSGYEVPLNRFCSLIESMGGIVNETCGLHVHFDFRGSTKEAVERRAQVLDAHMPFVKLLLPEHRRDNRYCRPGLSWEDRYRMVNLTAYLRYQTLEVRAHQGTIDHQKILNWIRLCEVLMGWPIGTLRTKTFRSWLEHLPLSMAEKDYWQERARQFSGETAFKTRLLDEGSEPPVNHPVSVSSHPVSRITCTVPPGWHATRGPDGFVRLDAPTRSPARDIHPDAPTPMTPQFDDDDDDDELPDNELPDVPAAPPVPDPVANAAPIGVLNPEYYITDNHFAPRRTYVSYPPIPPEPNLGMTDPVDPAVF
jgi:hypothetical protein